MLRRALLPSAGLVLGLAGVSLAGCGTTAATQRCTQGICTITLQGGGASVRVDEDGGHTVELVRAEGRVATLKVDGNTGPVTRNVPVGFGQNATLTVTSVGKDRATLTIDSTTSPEDAAIGSDGNR